MRRRRSEVMVEFLQHLAQISEKAARIAQAWKLEDGLFDLLVQEKTGEAKNQRFVQDYKTLADVLIQEVVRHDLAVKFPELAEHVYGEETNIFTDQQGVPIKIEVQSNQEETARLLSRLLGQHGDTVAGAAVTLAEIVHSNEATRKDGKSIMPLSDNVVLDLPLNNLAVWIDPIDGTGQYVSKTSETIDRGIIIGGMACVTILIGLFDKHTGKPVIGAVNQPFASSDNLLSGLQWRSNCIMGMDYEGQRWSNCDIKTLSSGDTPLRIAISSSEGADRKKHLALCGLDVYTMAGVGYKLLSVINGDVDLYILTKDSSFKWDTCGPHAILNSIGGGILPYKQALAIAERFCDDNQLLAALKNVELKYNKPDLETPEPGKKWCNARGLIAFRTYSSVISLLRVLLKRNEFK